MRPPSFCKFPLPNLTLILRSQPQLLTSLVLLSLEEKGFFHHHWPMSHCAKGELVPKAGILLSKGIRS